MTAFELWVCETVARVSGIWPRAIVSLTEEWPLTCAERRMDACQVGFGLFFNHDKQVSPRLISEVVTNKPTLH